MKPVLPLAFVAMVWTVVTPTQAFQTQTHRPHHKGCVVPLLPQTQSGLVAGLNGAPIDALTLDVLHQVALQKQPSTLRSATLAEIVANRLLAAQIAQRFKPYDVSANQRVGYAADVAADDQLVNYLRVVYSTQMQAGIEKTLTHAQIVLNQPGAASWDAVLGDANKPCSIIV